MSDNIAKKIYECGTLRYTLGGVVGACALIMLGFFCMNFVGAAVIGMIPVHLKGLGASNANIAFIMTTIGGIFNLTVCPAVSFKSDRYRGKRWGRRCVFIIGTLPMYCAAVFLFAGADTIGSWIAKAAGFAPATVTIMVFAVIMAMYQFFYMFVASVIYYIYNDIIPTRFLARVVGMTQVGAVAASAVFNLFFFRYTETHFSQLMIMVGCVYAVGTTLMCFLLKEPQLPPLDAAESSESRGIRGVFTFMRESFSHRFYVCGFLGTAFFSASLGISTFLIFFFRDMKLDLAAVGRINGISGMAGMVLGLVLATCGTILVDKWHPVRMHVFGMAMLLVIPLLNCRWLFISPGAELFFEFYLIENIIAIFLTAAVNLAGMPALIMMFPKSRFGQFCSARAMFTSLSGLLLGFLLGVAIDAAKNFCADENFVYRFLWCWRLFWGTLGAFFLIKMYVMYQKLGGVKSYRAPATWSESGFEELPVSPAQGVIPAALRRALFITDALIILLVAVYGAAFVYAAKYALSGTAAGMVRYALLPLAVLAAVYGINRVIWAKDVRQLCNGTSTAAVHHGVMYLGALILTLILLLLCWQIFKSAGSNGSECGIYSAAAYISATLVVLLAAWSGRIEKKSTTNQ